MHSLTPPAQLLAKQRRAELAGILAAALLRMRGHKGYVPPELRQTCPADAAEKGSKLPPENSQNPLDVLAELRLSVHPQPTNPSGKDTDQ